jgi:hypothetical protein
LLLGLAVTACTVLALLALWRFETKSGEGQTSRIAVVIIHLAALAGMARFA